MKTIIRILLRAALAASSAFSVVFAQSKEEHIGQIISDSLLVESARPGVEIKRQPTGRYYDVLRGDYLKNWEAVEERLRKECLRFNKHDVYSPTHGRFVTMRMATESAARSAGIPRSKFGRFRQEIRRTATTYNVGVPITVNLGTNLTGGPILQCPRIELIVAQVASPMEIVWFEQKTGRSVSGLSIAMLSAVEQARTSGYTLKLE